MARLHPGVYIEEVPSGVRPIEGVSTSTAALIGKAEMGKINEAVLVTSIQEFEMKYGTYLSDSYLSHAVFQFFNNGGKKCYIVRVAGTGARAAQIAIKDRKGVPTKTLTIKAASEGIWGNKLDLVITDGTVDPDNEYQIQVFKDRSQVVPPLPPLLLETHDDLSMNPDADNYVEKAIAANSQYIKGEVDDTNIDSSIEPGFSQSGKLPVSDGAAELKLNPALATPDSGDAETKGTLKSGDNPSTNPLADKRKLQITINGDGPHKIIIPPEAASGEEIAEAIKKIVREEIVANTATNQEAFTKFTCVYDDTPEQPHFYLLTSGTPGTNSSVIVGDGAVLLKLDPDQASGDPENSGTLKSGDNPLTNSSPEMLRFLIKINGDGPHDVEVPPEAATGSEVAKAIQDYVQKEIVADTDTNQPAFDNFTCVYDETTGPNPFYLLTSGTAGPNSSVLVESALPEDETISLPTGKHSFAIEINGDGPHLVTLEVTPDKPLANGDAIAQAITSAVTSITPKRSKNAEAFAPEKFSCGYQNGPGSGNPSLKLTSGKGGVNSSVRVTDALENNVAELLKLGVTNGGKEITGAAVLRPANSQDPTEYHLGDAVVSGNVDSVVLGDDGVTPVDQNYTKGLTALDVIRDVNIICIPGIGSKAVVDAGTNYCTQRKDCFFIGDVNQTDDTVKEAQDFANSLTVKSSYGAIYYPWLKMIDPTGKSPEPMAAPSSGFVAGMYARIDAKRGVWKAPAGTEANIGGAVGLVAATTDVEQDFLNPIGVNVIRSFPASGIVIWGARTLATRSDPEYRYIPVRRTAIFLEQSIFNGIQWAVFEPNDEDLWASLRLNINAFMMLQFRAGAFQGKTPREAFFVKCDADTTTQADIDAGTVAILVGFAPLKPAEFVVLKLSQKAGQPSA